MQKGMTERKQRERETLTVRIQVPKDGFGRLLQLSGNDEGFALGELSSYLARNLFEQINPASASFDGSYVGAIARDAAEELEKRRARA